MKVQPSDHDGTRVIINASPAASHLFGCSGVVEGRNWSAVDQRWNYIIRFDTPVITPGSPTPLETIGIPFKSFTKHEDNTTS